MKLKNLVSIICAIALSLSALGITASASVWSDGVKDGDFSSLGEGWGHFTYGDSTDNIKNNNDGTVTITFGNWRSYVYFQFDDTKDYEITFEVTDTVPYITLVPKGKSLGSAAYNSVKGSVEINAVGKYKIVINNTKNNSSVICGDSSKVTNEKIQGIAICNEFTFKDFSVKTVPTVSAAIWNEAIIKDGMNVTTDTDGSEGTISSLESVKVTSADGSEVKSLADFAGAQVKTIIAKISGAYDLVSKYEIEFASGEKVSPSEVRMNDGGIIIMQIIDPGNTYGTPKKINIYTLSSGDTIASTLDISGNN